MSAAVIAHGRADGLRDGVEVLDEFFDIQCFKGVMPLQCGVELVNVGLVMLGMVDFHGSRVDIWLKRVIGIVEFWQCMGHRIPPKGF